MADETETFEKRQCSASVVKEYNPPRPYVVWRRQCQNWFIPKEMGQTQCHIHRKGVWRS